MAEITLLCPSCGLSDRLATQEKIEGLAYASFLIEDGQREVWHEGETKVLWDCSVSYGVYCMACDWHAEDGDDGPAINKLVTPDQWDVIQESGR